jgi:CubicO group peptidase (beta-lactamase class C family)
METVTVKSIGAPTPLIATGASSGELAGFRPALGSEHGRHQKHMKKTTAPKRKLGEQLTGCGFRGVTASVLAFFALYFVSGLVAAEDRTSLARIRPAMQRFVDHGEIAGAVTVVGRKDVILSVEAVGQMNIEKQVPMTKDAIFQIASMTKPITAIGIMQLQEEGKLTIDDTVEKYLPEFKGQMLISEKRPDSLLLKRPSRPITLKDLLMHTSGLPSVYPAGLGDLYLKRDRTLAEGTLVISQQPLTFEPGTKWSYSPPGSDVLGRIIEVCSGMPYEDYVNVRIFLPLGMTDTLFYFDGEGERRQRVATIYEKKDGKLQQSAIPSGWVIGPRGERKHPVPAGGLYSTGADLAKLCQMMLNDGELGGKRILKPESVKQMTSLQTGDLPAGFRPGNGFGLGWEVIAKPQGATEMHSPGSYGHLGAWGTQFWLDRRNDLFVVLLIQRAGLTGTDESNLLGALHTPAVAAVKK